MSMQNPFALKKQQCTRKRGTNIFVMQHLLLTLLLFATAAHAINVAGITYDLDRLKLQEVVFLNSSEFKTEPVLHVVINHFTENFDTVGASVMKPWHYVLLTGEGSVFYSQVISIKDKSSTKPTPLLIGQNPITCYELHCTDSTCFCVDLSDHFRFVSFDPVTGNVSVAIDLGHAFIGVDEFQSAFDRSNLVGYYVLLDAEMTGSMYAVSFRSGEVNMLAGEFYQNGSSAEAYCFDHALGLLIGTNHPKGGLVAFQPSSNSTLVLLQRDLWGITSNPPACAGGELLVQIVDW